MKTTTPYLSNLTPLRGIAALLTVMFHVDLMLGNGGNLLVKFEDSLLFTRLYLMVDFFFVLSGFVMYHVYGKWFNESVQKVDFKWFTIARFARVYPLHFFTLLYCIGLKLIFFAAGGIDTNPMDAVSNNWAAIPSHLLLLHSMNVNEWFTWNNASWSISTEWWMYMLFPFLVKPFRGLNSVGRILVVVACFVGYLAITFLIVPIVTVPASIPFVAVNPADLSINVSYQYGFLRCLFGFVLGMMVYQFYTEGAAKRLMANGYTLISLTLGLGVCMHFAVPDVFSVAFFPLILLSAAYGSQNMDAFFGTKPMQRIGDWSFSIYLVHQPLMYTIGSVMTYLNPPSPNAPAGPPPQMDMLTGWIICVIFIAFTLLVSYLTYRFVEVPARNWINGRYGKNAVPAVNRV
ncbi:acyltransferase family protein [Runella salmonicolor]|uniref:Acyltransferase n=1 Tax=Runella salmonicolor TaxID=2950278 RepID=A0ABT1FLB8_9BACT|nr:acyltransferase [Runella salmonicolor]MCP1382526.1 acyltransferase [Runella salmonicolor]